MIVRTEADLREAMLRHSESEHLEFEDPHASDNYRVLLRLPGDVGDARFLRILEQVGDERLQRFTTDDFLLLDRVHRDEKVSDALKPRLKGLLAVGVVERTGRGKVILSKKLYAFMGENGVQTRKHGLDRETEKELLLKHLRSVGADGAPVSELLQVLKDRSRGHVRGLLAELREAGRARKSGTTKAGRWHVGP